MQRGLNHQTYTSGISAVAPSETVGLIVPTGEQPSKACLPREGFVREKALLAPIGPLPFSRSTLWHLCRTNRFPAPVKLSPKVTAWRVEDVRAFIADPKGGVSPHSSFNIKPRDECAATRACAKIYDLRSPYFRKHETSERDMTDPTQAGLGPAIGLALPLPARGGAATDPFALGPTLVQALEDGERFDGCGWRLRRREHTAQLLRTAYHIVVEVVAGGEAGRQALLGRLGLRKRAPSRDKLELTALEFVAKPEIEAERKLLSSYAPVLTVAKSAGLSPQGFRDWVLTVDFAECRASVRNLRARSRAGARNDQIFSSDPRQKEGHQLQLSIGMPTLNCLS